MRAVIDECLTRLDGTDPEYSREARRLFHGRGHTFPGYEHLTVTWLPPYLHIAAYAPVEPAEVEQLVAAVRAAAPQLEGVALQHREGRQTRTRVWAGSVPEEHVVTEHGLKFLVAPLRNQNVGLFLDMGHLRKRLAARAGGIRMLNLFAYTCAFSVAAVAHGAVHVVNNDMNRNMLNIGRRNHELNGHDPRKVQMLPHDLFRSWKRLGGKAPYNVIIIDPPTNQRGSFNAEKQYPLILKRLEALAAPGASIYACLNSPFLSADFLVNQMSRWSPRCRHVETLPPHEDFPERDPQRGLKVLEFRFG